MRRRIETPEEITAATLTSHITHNDIPEPYPSLLGSLKDVDIDSDWFGEVLNATLTSVLRADRIVAKLREGRRWVVGDAGDTALELSLWKTAFLLDAHSGESIDANEWHERLRSAIQRDIVSAASSSVQRESNLLTVIA